MRYAALVFCLILIGCAAPYKRIRLAEEPFENTELLGRFLDRSGSWEDFTAQFKVRLQLGDTTFTAKGFISYVSPEKYSLSFSRPYHQVIGDIYVTSTQLMYWGNSKTKLFFADQDTVHIPDLIPMSFPDWDPRDLLPFPVSGRTEGFQVTREFKDSLDQNWIHAECGKALHYLNTDPMRGVIAKEKVVRCSTDPVYKSYSRYYSIDGWPVPTRVTCENQDGRVKLTWSISNIHLNSPAYIVREPESSH